MGKARYTLLLALIALLACSAPAAAFTGKRLGAAMQQPKPQPLTGEGENLKLVANVPIDPGTQGNAGSDLELHGNHAFVGSYGEGVTIVDISNPLQPKRVGRFDCPGGQNDIQLSPDGKILALAIETTANKCHPGDEGTAILDVSDPTKPMELAWIGQDELEDGSHNNTLDWPYLYVDQYINTYSELEIFDLSDPRNPKKVGGIDYRGQDSHHDLIVDHRPGGQDLAYAASINYTDVLDVTNPREPVLRERIRDPQLGISHQAEPNHDRTLLLATDEYGGGTQVQACGGRGEARVPVPGVPAQFSDPASLGALHIYRLAPDGTIAGENGLDKAGVFNIGYQPNENPDAGCTIHVFWQAPDQNRLVTAWYGRGTRVVDFSDPANPKQLAWYVPTGGDTWSAKPHNGYIYAGDIVRGLDVFQYTGEGWPANAGPAEVQRARVQGAAPPNPTGTNPPSQGQRGKRRKAGRKAFTKHVRIPNGRDKKVTLVLSLYDSKKHLQTRLRLRTRDGRVARVRAQATGLSGHYRYTIRLGDRGRILGRGLIRVRKDDQTRVQLPPGQRLVCSAQAT
ncbi:MAG: hypothetical protein M3340_12335 [Actinomycetota bacterium]|nr:hypothetical protein [Actinomycetota bacterium]